MQLLLELLERTFGFSRITYLMAYCMYTGASVMVQDVKREDSTAAAPLQTFIRALTCGMASCPIVYRSLDIINKSLQSLDSVSSGNHPPTSGPVESASSQTTCDTTEIRYSGIGGSEGTIRPDRNATPTQNLDFGLGQSQWTTAPNPGYLPAFPYRDYPELFNDLVGPPSDTVPGELNFLDCFPEHRIEDTGTEWWLPG